jgi:ATP-binding cassette subfamily B multidrug efflux pump
MSINNFREDELTKEVIKRTTIKRLFKYMLAYKKVVGIVLSIMLVIITVTIVNPLFMEIAIDQYIANANYTGLFFIAGIALSINLLAMILSKIRIRLMAEVTNKILVQIRQELYEHIQKLSFNFFDKRPAGKILARVIGDVNALKDLLTNSVVTLIPDFITLIAVLTVMLIKNYRLAFAALAMLPFLVIGMWLIQIKAHKRWQVEKAKKSNINAFTYENFSGIKVVQSFSAEAQTSGSFRELLKEHRNAFFSAIYLNNLFWPMVELSWGIGTALVFIFGIAYIQTDTITVGLLVAFITYIGLFWQPIMNLSNFYNQLITNLAGAERIFEIMDIEPDIMDQIESPMMPEIEGRVEFDHVTFSYDDNTTILDDVSFTIEPGQTIALVGPTGGGKTTIVSLISRFYDIKQGSIRIDGHNTKYVNIESLRRQMGIMTQDTFLFTGTINDNIRYGRLDASDEDIIEAATAVHAHEFISKLEKGYETTVNEGGSELSVGQRQLIAFARTLLS